MGGLRDHCSDVISFGMNTCAGAYGHPMLMAIAEHDYPGMADAERIYGAWLYKVLTSATQTTDTGISAAATGYTSQAMIDLMHDRRFTQLVIECGTYESDGIGHTALMDDHFQHLRGETSGRELDRKSVVEGKSVSVGVDLGGRSVIKKHNKKECKEVQ